MRTEGHGLMGEHETLKHALKEAKEAGDISTEEYLEELKKLRVRCM